MKKLIIIVVILLAVVFIGAPYFTGKIAQSETMKLVEKVNQSPALYGTTQVIDYQRGVRSTTAHYKYTPPESGSFAAFSKEFGEIAYRCESEHGLTGIDYQCQLEGESIYSKFVADKLNGQDPLRVFGSISAFGDFQQTLALDPVAELKIDGTKMNIPKAELTVKTNAQGQVFDFSGRSETLNMQGNGETLSLGVTSLDGHFTRLADVLFTGDFSMEVDHFTATGAQGGTSFDKLAINSVTNEQEERISSSVLFSVKQLSLPNSPFQSIDNVSVGADIKGLNKQALIDYQTLVQQIQQEAMASLDNQQQPQVDPAQMAKLMPIVEQMLKPGLGFSSKLSAKLDGKPNSLSIDLTLIDSLSLVLMPLFLSNPDEAVKKLDVSLEASLDKSVVDQQPLIATLVAQSPLIKRHANRYTTKLKLGKTIELNGDALSFSELQSLVFSSLPSSQYQ